MQNNEKMGMLPSTKFKLEYVIPATGYSGESVQFDSELQANRFCKKLEKKRQIMMKNGLVVNIEEEIQYNVVPTLN